MDKLEEDIGKDVILKLQWIISKVNKLFEVSVDKLAKAWKKLMKEIFS